MVRVNNNMYESHHNDRNARNVCCKIMFLILLSNEILV